MGPKKIKSTVLSEAEEAIVVFLKDDRITPGCCAIQLARNNTSFE